MRNSIAALLIAGSTLYSGYLGYAVATNKPLKDYVRKNANAMMTAEVRELQLRPTDFPTIRYVDDERNPGTEYDPREDVITIDQNTTVSPGFSPENLIIKMLIKNPDRIEEDLYHEFGHHYQTWLRHTYGLKEPETEVEKMRAVRVKEGMAEYFKIRMTGSQKIVPLRTVFYKMVKPIIDNYGEGGIVFMLANPPAVDESNDEYQKRVLGCLDRQQ